MIIKGLKINYKIIGEGKPLLILHGWGSNSEKWQRVAELLARKGFKVIVPDLSGFGQSQEPKQAWGLDDYCNFVEEFVKILGLEKFFLLGHSFGGALAIKLSLRIPEKIEKLFLVSASFRRRKKLKKRVFGVLAKTLKIFSFLPLYPYFKRGFYKFLLKSDYPSTRGIMRKSYLKIIKEDLSDILNKIKIPAIIIWGEKDDITPLKHGRLLNEKIKESELVVLPAVGHNIRTEAPEKLTQIISKFL